MMQTFLFNILLVYNIANPTDTLQFFMKVVATVAFGMGLDKRDVGAVSLLTSFIFCINLHDLVSEKRSSLVWYTQKVIH
jgi:hypothetical protein